MQIKTNGVIAYTRSEQFPLVVGNDPGREFYERKILLSQVPLHGTQAGGVYPGCFLMTAFTKLSDFP